MKKTYEVPALSTSGTVVATTKAGIGGSNDVGQKGFPAGSVGFAL